MAAKNKMGHLPLHMAGDEYVCMNIYVCICMHTCIYVCIHQRERECVCVSERERVCVCIRERERECVCVSERERECVCVYQGTSQVTHAMHVGDMTHSHISDMTPAVAHLPPSQVTHAMHITIWANLCVCVCVCACVCV